MPDPEQNQSRNPAPDPEPIQPESERAPATPSKKDWLATVARATETVAPLVARQAPKADQLPTDTRGRWATVLAIAGILVAVLQFLVQFYDLVTRPLAPLAGALPYLAAGLLIVAAGAGIYALLRARTRRQRLIGGLSTLVVLVAAGSWGGWLAYDSLRPPSGYRILISEFDGSTAPESIDFGRRIAETLREQLTDAGLPIEIKRTTAIYPDAETARREGARQKAGIVIWGWYDAYGVSPHVEVLSLPGSEETSTADIPILFATANAAGSAPGSAPGALQPVLSKLTPVTRTPATLPSLALFTDYGAGQMAYIASTVLAMSHLANGDLEQALALFDQALANLPDDQAAAPAGAQGQEVVYYGRATVNYRLGRYDAARADLEQALQIQPDYAPAHLLRAAVLADQCTPGRDLPAALAAARRAAALAPNDPAAQRLLGDLLLRSGDAEAALAAAQSAQTLAPDNIDTENLLARVFDALGRAVDSRAARERALALAQQAVQPASGEASPAQPSAAADAFYQLGDAYLALDRYDEALAAYTQAQSAAPTDPRIHLAKGNVYYWRGNREQAHAEYTAWAQAAPKDPAPQLMLGLLADEEDDTQSAAAYYTQAASLGRCDPAPYLLLAGAQMNAGDYDAAQENYARALVIDPQNAAALFAAANSDLLREDYAAAAAKFGELAGRQPTSAAATYYWGEALEKMGDQDRAQAAYAAVASLGEASTADAAEAGVYLAYAYEKLGRTDDAIATYLRLIDAGETADLHAYLGLLYVEKGATDLAQTEYERALALNPQHLPALYGLGGLADARGDWAAAAAKYEAYLALYETAEVHNFAARAYQLLGALPAALRHLQAAVRLESDDPALAQRLAYVANWLNRLDVAEAAAQSALRLRPADPGLYLLQGQLAYKRCDLAGAVAALDRSVELSPTNSLYTGLLSGYLLAGEAGSAAVQPYLAQLTAAPADDYLAHWLAGSLLVHPAFSSTAALTATPGLSVTANLTATPALTTAGELTRAAAAQYTLALAAPDLPPSAAAALHTARGQLAYTGGDYAAAQEVFSAALDAAPGYVDALLGLGDLALLAGDPAAASDYYTQAQENLSAYAAAYSYDSAAIFAPVTSLRLSLAARLAGDETAESAALQAAADALAFLEAAAPDWPSVRIAGGMRDLLQGNAAAAHENFARAAACDRAFTYAEAQVQELVGAAQKPEQD